MTASPQLKTFQRISPKIDTEDPFEDDLLNRKPLASLVRNIVDHSHNPMVVSLDAGWGQGKTTFLKMLKGMLDSDYMVVYLDTWSIDHSTDPMIAIMGEIQREISSSEQDSAVQKKFEKSLEEFSKLARASVPALMKTFVKAGGAALGFNEGVFKELVNGLADFSKEGTQALIDQHNESVKGMATFSEKLTDLASKVKGKKIVFLVDELDRCRPDFALDFLECIKHFFSVDRTFFLVATNKARLSEMISNRYGHKVADSETYLTRLFNHQMWLPEPNADDYYRLLVSQRLDDLWREHLIISNINRAIGSNDNMGHLAVEALKEFPYMLAKQHKLSLRQLDDYVSHLSLLSMMAGDQPYFAFLVTLSIATWAKLYHPQTWELLDSKNESDILGAVDTIGLPYLENGVERNFRHTFKWCTTPSSDLQEHIYQRLSHDDEERWALFQVKYSLTNLTFGKGQSLLERVVDLVKLNVLLTD